MNTIKVERGADCSSNARHCVPRFIAIMSLYAAMTLLEGMASGQMVSNRPTCDYTYRPVHIVIRRRPVLIDMYVPTGEAKGLVVILHGSLGPLNRRDKPEPRSDSLGEFRMVTACYMVALPRYFDLFGSTIVTTDLITESLPDMAELVLGLYNVYSKQVQHRLYIFGESLGGYIAIYLASHYKHIDGVSVAATGWHPLIETAGHVKLLPPLMIAYGAADRLVTMVDVYRLAQMWRDHKGAVELNSYPCGNHYITVSNKKEIADDSVAFFDSLVRGRVSGRSVHRSHQSPLSCEHHENVVTQAKKLSELLSSFGLDEDMIEALPEVPLIARADAAFASCSGRRFSELDLTVSLANAFSDAGVALAPGVTPEAIHTIRMFTLPRLWPVLSHCRNGNATARIENQEPISPIETVAIVAAVLGRNAERATAYRASIRDIRAIMDAVLTDAGVAVNQ